MSWEFSADHNDLQKFEIQLKKDDQMTPETTVTIPVKSDHDIDSLLPSKKYTIKLIATFRDGFNSEAVLEHINCGELPTKFILQLDF